MPNSKKSTCKTTVKESKQWIIISPESAFSSQSGVGPSFIKLHHPRTCKGAQFQLSSDEKSIFEITKFKEEPRSWFIEDTVQQDGSLLLATPIDPIFLCLPYFEKCAQKFRTLDQILIDNTYPAASRLSFCITPEALANICDCKGDDDLQVYRLNDDKVIAWLKNKVESVADYLSTSEVNVSKGSQSATFVRSRKHSDVTRDDHLRYSYGIVCDYLSVTRADELKAALNLPEEQTILSSPEEPPNKRVKLSSEDGGDTVEDYSKEYEKLKSKIKEPSKGGKMTAAQKSLSKVDKTGMKSISSFFGTRSKSKAAK